MTQETHKTTDKQNSKPLQKINFPWKITRIIGPIKWLKTGEPEKNRQKLKEPIAFIIKSNYEVDIRENVKEGFIELDREIGGTTETVRIFNPKSKLLSFPIGDTVYRGWILDEKEAVALPTDIRHDSLVLKRIMEALMLNYQEFKTKRMNQYIKLALYIGGAIIILILGMGLLQISLADIIGIQAPQAAVQNVTYVIDANAIAGI